jgi:type II secretory pathway component PulM
LADSEARLKAFSAAAIVTAAQQRFAERHHRAVAQRAQVEQAGEGAHRAFGIAGVEAPDAEPVQAFAGENFERHGLRQRRLAGGDDTWVAGDKPGEAMSYRRAR